MSVGSHWPPLIGIKAIVTTLNITLSKMPRKPLQEIASADDGEISGELLDWSGLSKMWHEQGLAGDYDFLRDVAEHTASQLDIAAFREIRLKQPYD